MDSKQTFNQEMCSWINVDSTQSHEVKKLRESYATVSYTHLTLPTILLV